MNYARVALAAVVAWVVSVVLGFVINGFLLAGLTAANQPPMRPEEELTGLLPIGFVFLLIGFFAFAYIYARGYEGGSGIAEGARFGFVISLVILGFGIVWQYVVYPISGAMSIAMSVDCVVEATIYGAIVGAIYKPNTIAKPVAV